MNIADLLTPQRVRCAAKATSKKRSLELLSELLSGDGPGPAARTIFENLVGRERLGSTGLGRGVALPHCRVDGIDTASAALVTLEQPVDFDAIDKRPVDVLFALLVPERSTDTHLRMLAALAERFSDRDFCDRLRASHSADQLYATFTERQDGRTAP